jgi:polyadenylate-binding protein
MAEYPPPHVPEGPQLHPYLHEPLLYITNLPPYITDENLATAFASCAPFRPNIPRDGTNKPLSGTIEFKYLEKGLLFTFAFHHPAFLTFYI